MVLTEIINTIAALLGFSIDEFDYFDSVETSLGGVVDGFGEAEQAANKFKRGLRGFDKLNVITTPASSQKGGVGGGGIDPSIINEFDRVYKDYNKRLTEVQMKATKIRDTIMEWLGFTKKVNSETGKVSFKFEKFTFGTLLALVGTGFTIYNTGRKIFGLLNKIFKFKTVSKIEKTTKAAGKLAGAKGLGGLFKLLNWKVALVAALAGGLAYLVKKGLEPATKQVDLFKNVSEETTKKLKPFIDKTKELSLTVSKIQFQSFVTDSDVEKVKSNLSQITTYLKDDYKKDVQEVEEKIRDMQLFPNLTDEERKNIIDRTHDLNAKRNQEVDNAQKRINEIYDRASKERRQITQEESNEVQRLMLELQNKGIETLTETEEEQRIIKTRMKDNAVALSVEESSEILKTAVKNKEKVIEEARKERDEKIKIANKLYYDLGAITKEEYDKITTEAEESFKKQKESAETEYQGIADAVETKLGKASKNIDLETGKIFNKFQKWGNSIVKWWNGLKFIDKKPKVNPAVVGEQISKQYKSRRFDYSINASGGMPPTGQLFYANEAGPELVGQVGGRTFVANQNQMLGLIRDEIHSNKGNQRQLNFYLDPQHKIGSYVLNDLDDMARQNGSPIVIGG